MIRKVKFKTAPVNELIFGVRFSAENFNPVHYGLYWESIKDRFPKISKHDPIITETGERLMEELPLPRVWFESIHQDRLIQLQQNRFHFNWRRDYERKEYPKFPALLEEFLSEYEKFVVWCRGLTPVLKIKPILLELTYMNHYDKKLGWESLKDTAKVLNLFDFSSLAKGFDVSGFGSGMKFVSRSQSIGEVVFQGNEAIHQPTGTRLFQTNSTIRSSEFVEHKAWFESAHNLIVEFLLSVTPKAALENWGFEEE